MARKPRQQIAVIRCRASVALGTLGAEIFAAASMMSVLGRDFFAISADLVISMSDHTAGEGPVSIGVNHNDYTVTQVKEWFDATAAVGGPTDLVVREQARRKCREIGVMPGLAALETLDHGSKIRVPLRFTIEEGATLALWVQNKDLSSFTTGTLVQVSGKLFGRWL